MPGDGADVSFLRWVREKGPSFSFRRRDAVTGVVRKSGLRKTGREAMKGSKITVSYGPYGEYVNAVFRRLEANDIVRRIRERDYTLWKPDPDEIENRLGWFDSPRVMLDAVDDITAFAHEIRKEGFTDVLLLGMGGSSLAPEMMARVFGTRAGYPVLAVCDSTDPEAILFHAEKKELTSTLFIVATKSGTTVETISFFKYFYTRLAEQLDAGDVGKHFVAITDRGSALEKLAERYKFRRTFFNDETIGGRYSALSYFGLVPAALVGIDIKKILLLAGKMRDAYDPGGEAPSDADPGMVVGVAMGALAARGVNKITFVTSPDIAPFGAWVEQLIAESTGKEGKGILPVIDEIVGDPSRYGRDRFFVHLSLNGDETRDGMVAALADEGFPVMRCKLGDRYDIGGEFFLWELATAIAGHCLGINPFNQPDVESAKVQAWEAVSAYQETGLLPAEEPTNTFDGIQVYGGRPADSLGGALATVLRGCEKGDYIAVQAYLNPHAGYDSLLEEMRNSILDKCRIATTIAYGPRFLHSTGQLHKGDAGKGRFIQITAEDGRDVPIPDTASEPGSSLTFGILKAAQAMGDRGALKTAGRRVIRCHLTGDVSRGLRILCEAVKRCSVS